MKANTVLPLVVLTSPSFLSLFCLHYYNSCMLLFILFSEKNIGAQALNNPLYLEGYPDSY